MPTLLKPSHLNKLSPIDIQFRREKGLWLSCDEKYSLTHKCANKHYFLLQTTKEVDDLVAKLDYHQLAAVNPQDDGFDHHLSYHALKGTTARGTIRFTGYINGIETQILLNGGNSDNFIQPRLVKFLKLTAHPAPPFQVVVRNGEQLACEGQVHNIPIHIQGYCLHVLAYLLPIVAVELVLGTQWLTLDTHLVNYNQHFIAFYMDCAIITLQGYTSSQASLAQFHHFKRLQVTSAIGELYTLQLSSLVQFTFCIRP